MGLTSSCTHTGAMVDIYYAEVNEGSDRRLRGFRIDDLPAAIMNKANSYRRWQDRQASLLGKLLLRHGLVDYGYASDSLHHVSRDEYGRPFLDENVDFNISHSGDYVVCAVSRNARVGIDIEKVTTSIDLADFAGHMNPDQFEKICRAENRYSLFYETWTKNEAVIKADGRGLSIPLTTILDRGDKATLNGIGWFLEKIGIDTRYCCFLAVNSEKPVVNLNRIDYLL
jgi:4'-phosphopantetheinyl transferase